MKLSTKISFKLAIIVFSLAMISANSSSNLNSYGKAMFSTGKTELMKIASSLTNTKALKVKQIHMNDTLNDRKDKNRIVAGSVVFNALTKELTFFDNFLEKNEVKNPLDKLIARGRYSKTLGEIGWSKLFVETFDECPSEIQSFAAGYIEGKLTAKNILEFYKNLVGIHSEEGSELNSVFSYYSNVEKSIRKKTTKESLAMIQSEGELEYWITVAMVQAQTDGLHLGYNSVMKNIEELSFDKFYFINADGEVPELLTVFHNNQNNANGSNNQFSFKQRTKENLRASSLNSRSIEKFSPEYLLKEFGSKDPEEVWYNLMTKSHCSAVIKNIYDSNGKIDDVMVAHTTWDSYSEMHRIMKIYDFKFTLFANKQRNAYIMFSSYPGTLTSTDDFYLVNKKLSIVETTIEILDKDVYNSIKSTADNHVPNYIRISIAHRMADSGKQWCDIFKRNNSGTYNSQWMVLDYQVFDRYNNQVNSYIQTNTQENSFSNKRNIRNHAIHRNNSPSNSSNSFMSFMGGQTINDMSYFYSFKSGVSNSKNRQLLDQLKGFFHILEQIPEYIHVEDLTSELMQKGYWASFNRPYFKEVYAKTGYEDMAKRYGVTYTYDSNKRAIFIKDKINEITGIESLKALMQSTKDISGALNLNSISPRFDLDAKQKKSSGGIDTKITSYQMAKTNTINAISGPAYKDNNSVFSWNEFLNEPHFGLPNTWKFDWVNFNEEVIKNKDEK